MNQCYSPGKLLVLFGVQEFVNGFGGNFAPQNSLRDSSMGVFHNETTEYRSTTRCEGILKIHALSDDVAAECPKVARNVAHSGSSQLRGVALSSVTPLGVEVTYLGSVPATHVRR